MKKFFFFSLGLIVAFASLFVSCNEDDTISDSKEKVSKHKAIDLGLPSGTMWATCNVGANSPEEYGGYYAWGETEEKSNYDLSTYKWCNGSSNSITKYCTEIDDGTVDNKTVLDPEDDVAHVKWGGDWRMPTFEEYNELRNNCYWNWTTHNGVNGYRVTGPNGNSIFLPAAGWRDGTDVNNRGYRGSYWLGLLYSNNSNAAYNLYFYDNDYNLYIYYRYYGQSVRPVLSAASFKPENSCTVSVSNNNNGMVSIKDEEKKSAIVVKGSTVTVVAVPNSGYNFYGWFIGDGEEPVSTEATYTFIVMEDLTLVAKFESKNNINGHEYVDLGLPSGLKWATCNVGANSPEEYGGYYAWGETEEKSNYDWSTYKWCNGSYNTMIKYCNDTHYGTVDNKTVLDLEDDVAHVKWGGSWRMPTTEEQCELLDNCTLTWTTQNGVKGYRVTGPNGNCIFLPNAGGYDGVDILARDVGSCFWSSSLYSAEPDAAIVFFFDHEEDYYDWDACNRSLGLSVRPVSK